MLFLIGVEGAWARRFISAVHLGGSQLDELAPACDEIVEFGLLFPGFCEGPWSNLLSEASDDSGIDAVGFGEDPERFGEVSDLPGIDHGDRIACREEFGNDGAFIASGRFEDDEAVLGCGQPFQERLPPGAVVGNGKAKFFGSAKSFRSRGDVERVLGDIDADDEEVV